MINTKLLKAAIAENGMRQSEVAEKIGISMQSFSSKINNKTQFKIDEVYNLCSILNINGKIEKIFFAQ